MKKKYLVINYTFKIVCESNKLCERTIMLHNKMLPMGYNWNNYQ